MTICKKDIYEIIAKLLNVDDEMIKNIKEDDDLMLHGMTSISCIQLLVNIEEKYGINFKDEDLLIQKFNTLKKLFTLLETYLGENKVSFSE